MFDCPPHSHTSPTSTSCNSTIWRPVILMLYGPPGGGGWIFTHQRPSGPVTVLAAWPAISTRTASPGSDHPQIVFGFPRCRTMLSPNIGLTNGSGPTSVGGRRRKQCS